MEADRILTFPVERIASNRFSGLLRELHEALDDCDDPATLRAVGQSLKLLGDGARAKGFELQPKRGNRHW